MQSKLVYTVEMLIFAINYGHVGFEVFTAVVVKSAIFWDVTPFSPLSVNRRFGGKSCSAYFFDPEDGGDMFLRNVG
jgi:hypothetical protein